MEEAVLIRDCSRLRQSLADILPHVDDGEGRVKSAIEALRHGKFDPIPVTFALRPIYTARVALPDWLALHQGLWVANARESSDLAGHIGEKDDTLREEAWKLRKSVLPEELQPVRRIAIPGRTDVHVRPVANSPPEIRRTLLRYAPAISRLGDFLATHEEIVKPGRREVYRRFVSGVKELGDLGPVLEAIPEEMLA